MSTTEIDVHDLDAAARAVPAGRPVVMVNLLRFRDRADYAATIPSGDDLPAVTGREAYLTRYLPAFDRVAAPHGTVELLVGAEVAARVVGPPDADWDAVAVVRYPSVHVFRDVVTDPRYAAEAAPHRLAALADWRLFATTPLSG